MERWQQQCYPVALQCRIRIVTFSLAPLLAPELAHLLAQPPAARRAVGLAQRLAPLPAGRLAPL